MARSLRPAAALLALCMGCGANSGQRDLGPGSGQDASAGAEDSEGNGNHGDAAVDPQLDALDGETPPGDAGPGDPADGDTGTSDGASDDGAASDTLDPQDGEAGACPSPDEVFVETVWQPVLGQRCLPCHNPTGYAAQSGMVFLPESEPDWLSHNRALFDAKAAIDVDGEPLVLLKPTNTHPQGHGGNLVVDLGSQEHLALEAYVAFVRGEADGCAAVADSCTEVAVGPRLLRRLTPKAYDNTITDLLGIASEYGEKFAADDQVAGFSNNAAALDVSSLLASQLLVAAEELAAQAVKLRLPELLPCDPQTTGQPGCAAEFVATFGRRAFRRPLTLEEIDRYFTLWDEVARESDFATGVQWVITAMLQSPHFLYRSELGAPKGGAPVQFALSDWEVASELSYLVWDTMPDDALFARAAAGELHTPAQIQAELQRMMLDPRARRLTERFLEQWLHLGRLVKVPKVMQVYPALTFDVRHEMVGETERRVHHLLVAGASLSELLQAKHTWLTDALASYYGIPTADAPSSEPDEAGYRRVELPGDTYGGLLTQGALSTLHAGPDASSPVKRGVFVRERLLCQPIPPPPPGIDVTPPAPDPAASTREQYEQHSADPVCKGCHERIDGVGFALEHFDGAGVWRPSDGEHPIDATGALVAMPGSSTVGTFDGANELAAVLSQSTEVDRCYVKTWLTHATGLVDAPPVQCGVAALQTQNGGTTPLTAPLTHLAASDHLRLRVAGPDEAAAPLGPQEPNLDAYHALPEAPYPPLPGEGAPGSGDAVLSLTTVSQWATGYCADGVVSNQSDQEVQWKVSAKVDGEIVNIWNAVQSKQGNLTTFTGVSWNSTVAPGGTQSFGFCANL